MAAADSVGLSVFIFCFRKPREEVLDVRKRATTPLTLDASF